MSSYHFDIRPGIAPQAAKYQPKPAAKDGLEGILSFARSLAGQPEKIAGAAAQAAKTAQSSGSASSQPPQRSALDAEIDSYFKPRAGAGSLASLPELFMPSQRNVQILSRHAEAKFKQFMSDHDIPEAPAKITFGRDGKLQLPEDYAYGAQLREAFDADPAMLRELSTVHAMASHMTAMEESAKFSEEYTAAKSSADADAIIAKYAHLFNGTRRYAEVALEFGADGSLRVSEEDKPLESTKLRALRSAYYNS